MTVIYLILTALRGLSANKLRAVLTTLGVVIGVASVIAMLALGNGARAAVAANFRFLGSDEIMINQRLAMKKGELVSSGKILSYQDGLTLPAEVPLIDRVDMSVGGPGKARHGRDVADLTFLGETDSGLETLASRGDVQPANWPQGKPLKPSDFIAYGRFYTPAEVLGGADVCVLGSQTAQDLFGGDDPLGQTVWLNHRSLTVIGVLAELEYTDPEQRYRSDPNILLTLPISTAIQKLYDQEPSVSITAHVTDESKMTEIKYQVSEYLRRRHNIQSDASGNAVASGNAATNGNPTARGGTQDDFDLTTRNDILGAQQSAARTFSLLLAAMAVVSLAVGGIGIMNVMLVSVTERTREIGIRLAVGAQGRDIVLQFLLEAVMISALGGLFGIAVGVLVIPLAASLNNGVALLAPNSIPLAFGVALLTGVVFGIYPAARASRLDPIEALRYE
jgi:putative ABC transport system permease protein